MVIETTSFLGGFLSLLRNLKRNYCKNSDVESKSQIIPHAEDKIHRIIPCDSIIISDNNNYLKNTVVLTKDEHFQQNDVQLLTRWSSNSNWTRTAPLISKYNSTLSSSSSQYDWWWLWCIGIVAGVVLLSGLVIGVLLLANPQNKNYIFDIPYENSSESETNTSEILLTSVQTKYHLLRVNMSKQAWFALQKNEKTRHLDNTDEISTDFFSTSKDKVHRVPCGTTSLSTPCCKLEKSTEILKYPGCEPLQVPKHNCRGECDIVYIEGRAFEPIPRCQGVSSRKLKFKLICGNQVKRVSRDIVSRCRCA